MKLVYYHPIAVKDKHPFQSVVNPLISVMDRTKNTWPKYDYINMFPMPEVEDGVTDFNKIGVERINSLVNNYEKIAVLWSGGIDSTYILTLMIENGHIAKLYKDGRLTIGLNSESIRENPVFYEKFIKSNYINCVVQADTILKNPDRWSTIITGEMADNLVGSLTMKSCVDYYNDFGIVHKPWGLAVDWLCRNLGDQEKLVLRDFIDRTVENAPVKIITNHDLMWYLNFNYKWQAVNFRIVSHTNNSLNGNFLIKKLNHFFNTNEFQQWSMQEGHYFTGSSWQEYKMPMKKQILHVTGDKEYFKNKTKYPSLPGLLRYSDTFDFIYFDESTSNYVFTKSQVET